MTEAKPKRRLFRFSLRQMFISTTCFAVALSIVCFNNYLGDFGADMDLRRFLFMLAIPAVGAAIGGAIGVLIQSTTKSAIIGAMLAVVLMSALAVTANYK